MPTHNSTRQRLLAAAVELLGRSGVQAITHRNVEEEAGVARGSTRYYFRTRDELLVAVLDDMAATSRALLEQAAEDVEGATLEPGAMSAGTQSAALHAMVGLFLADPDSELARFELFLYAARRPELADRLAQWRGMFLQLSAAHLKAMGAAHPEAGARMMVAAMDGLVLHALTVPHEDFREFGPKWIAGIVNVAVDLDGGGTGSHAQVRA